MSVAPKQIGLREIVGDLPTGGAIPMTVGSRSEQYRAFVLDQTTAGQSMTIPAPADATVIFGVDVFNRGSVPFTMYGTTVLVASVARFGWNGAAWVPDGSPAPASSIVETLSPTAQNTIPDVAFVPKPGTSVMFFVNGALATSGFSLSLAGNVTVDPVVLGYNVEVVDTVTVVYYA
jgi:hypothetical protein